MKDTIGAFIVEGNSAGKFAPHVMVWSEMAVRVSIRRAQTALERALAAETRRREQAIELATNGLGTDGGHHKQWYLERILESLGVDLVALKVKLNSEDYDWEEGIAP